MKNFKISWNRLLSYKTKLLLIILLAGINCNYYPGFPMASPWVHTPQMDPFANMGLGLSAYPPPKVSTFSKDWQKGGFKSMYNLNFMAPYAMDVGSQGWGHSPYVSQMNYNTFPTYLTNGQYNPYGYNLADPRYHALYQRYYGLKTMQQENKQSKKVIYKCHVCGGNVYEMKTGKLAVKNMIEGSQEMMSIDELIEKFV